MHSFFESALTFSYAGVMILLGLSLSIRDILDIFRYPKGVLVGLISQMLLLPALAILLVSLFPMPDHLKIGFILLSACPGGSTSNLASYMLRGNVALSVSLTTVNSFLVIFSVPTILTVTASVLHFGGETPQLPFWDTVLKIIMLTLVPCMAGIFFRAQWTNTAIKIERIFKYLMPVLMAISILGVAFLGESKGPKVGIDDYLEALPVALALNVSSMVLGYLLGLGAGLNLKDRFTVGIEVGIQNSALAIAIASLPGFMNNPRFAVPAIVYLLFPFFTALVFGYLANRKEMGRLSIQMFNLKKKPE